VPIPRIFSHYKQEGLCAGVAFPTKCMMRPCIPLSLYTYLFTKTTNVFIWKDFYPRNCGEDNKKSNRKLNDQTGCVGLGNQLYF
jgi:hypothetical protein